MNIKNSTTYMQLAHRQQLQGRATDAAP